MPRGKACFPRTARLTSPGDYRRVFKKHYRNVDALFVVSARDNGRSNARLGLVVSKRNVRRAVDRNRLKRQIRENFRRNQLKLSGFDLVVKVLSGAVSRDNAEVQRSLNVHWDRLVGK